MQKVWKQCDKSQLPPEGRAWDDKDEKKTR